MTRRQRRRTEARRRNAHRLAAGAGLGITAALGFAGPAQADVDVITVNSLADPGDGTCDATECTLREAVAETEDFDAGTDRILFASGLSGTITLDPMQGSISTSDPLTIQGPGPDVITVSGGDASTILNSCCIYAAPLTVSGLTFSHSSGTAGAVTLSGGKLVLSDMVIEDNQATATGGGAVYAYGGSIDIRNSTITRNTADGTGGAIQLILTSRPEPYEGLKVTGSEISGNTSVNGTGGAIYTRNASPVIRHSSITGNEASDSGGAIYATKSNRTLVVKLDIDDSTIADNTAQGYGGGIELAEATTLDLTRSTVSGNSAVGPGGGIYGDRVNIDSSTLSNNSTGDSAYGGGVAADELYVDSSTVSGNSAPGSSDGGGLWADGTMTVTHSTISGNAAGGSGGGLYKQGGYYGELTSSIVANNTAPTGPDLYGSGFDVDFTLVEDDSDATINETLPGSNLFGVDPQLGPLAGNGGPTPTHRPANGSPVVDAGTAFGVNTDQRGFTRPVDQPGKANSMAPGADGADMGSVELTLTEVTPPTNPNPPGGQPGGTTPPASSPGKKHRHKPCTKKRRRAGKCKKK